MHEILNTRQKALALNLDARTYGTLAEICAGQEVARWFFAVGASRHYRKIDFGVRHENQ